MTENRWNIPNALALFRLVGSFVLVGIAIGGWRTAFAWLLFALLLSDWLDGKLAIWWNQRTLFGARLDSTADAAMYAGLLFGLLWLEWNFVRREQYWVGAALASYAVTTLAGLIRYGRVPSYHTRAAKTCWLLVGIAAVFLFAGWSPWPARFAMAAVTLTNLEATCMTLILPRWQADVPSLFHAWRLRDRAVPAADQAQDNKREHAEDRKRQDHVPSE